jgi:hypothetical protein
MTTRTLTPNQQLVLAILRKRDAWLTASATERHWLAGQRYYLDTRNNARRGIVRLFNQGNREAERSQP